MTDAYGKRARDGSEDGGRPPKREASSSSSRMVEDFLESMDPSVRIKLRSMFDDGLLMYSDLDERNITELGKFDASVALAILEHYCSGDLSQVRNRRAYLAGAIKRRAHMARDTYEPPPLAPDGLPVLVPQVQRRFDQVKSQSPKVSELDQRSLDALAALPPSCALAALDRFGAMDFAAVRNPSALFMSIVRNIMETEQGDRDWGPPSRGGGGYRGGPPPYRDPYDRDPYDRDPYRDPYDREEPYGNPAPPPPPPPRQAPALQPQYAAATAAGSLPPGTLVTAGAGGGLLMTGAGLVGALQASLPGLQPLSGGGVPAGTPGLMLAAAPGAGGVPQYVVVSSSSTGLAQPSVMQVLGGQALQLQAAPLAMGLQQQQQPAPAPAAAAVAQGVSQEWAAGRRNHGVEQGQLGVRVSEFHDLSPYAVYVHPSPALKLQQLWDNGNELVSMLDDKVWQVLAEMPAPEALAAIGEAADALDKPGSHVRNINALFMSVVRKVWPQHGGSAVYSHNGHQAGGYSGSRGSSSSRGDNGAAAGGGGGPPHHHHHQHHRSREPAIHLLPPEQRLLAQSLCKSHAPLLTEEHFDEGVIESLRRLSHEEGMCVLRELGTNSMAGVRNVPAYIMGIAKRYSTGQRKVAGGGGGRVVG